MNNQQENPTREPVMNPAMSDSMDAELRHIFESGPNEIRIKEMLNAFIGKHYTLTPEEMEIIDITADLWNKFYYLERRTDQDRADVSNAIHIIQRIVMARLARRVHPNKFRQS